MRSNGVALALLTALLAIDGSEAQTPPQPRVVLVELFTSEGCSSCPPADALLRKLDGLKTGGNPGELIVGLSEHVTYWNQLGWADPFSQQIYTDRQNAYGERFRLDSVYTPQVVVNGRRQVLGSDGSAILSAVSMEPGASPVSLHIDSIDSSTSSRKLSVTFSVGGHSATNLEVYAVIADDMATSSVLRGENSGRTLKHVAVARSFERVATLKDGKTATVSLPIPALVKGQPETARHLIVFAQESGLGRILAIDTRGL